MDGVNIEAETNSLHGYKTQATSFVFARVSLTQKAKQTSKFQTTKKQKETTPRTHAYVTWLRSQ